MYPVTTREMYVLGGALLGAIVEMKKDRVAGMLPGFNEYNICWGAVGAYCGFIIGYSMNV